MPMLPTMPVRVRYSRTFFFSDKRYDLGEVGRYRINKKLGLTTDSDVRVLTKEDIIEIIKYLIKLINSNATVDDIDHLPTAVSVRWESNLPTSSLSVWLVWPVPSVSA